MDRSTDHRNILDRFCIDFFYENISVRYTLKDQMIPEMEVKFTKDELDTYQLKTWRKLPLTGLDIWFSSIDKIP